MPQLSTGGGPHQAERGQRGAGVDCCSGCCDGLDPEQLIDWRLAPSRRSERRRGKQCSGKQRSGQRRLAPITGIWAVGSRSVGGYVRTNAGVSGRGKESDSRGRGCVWKG